VICVTALVASLSLSLSATGRNFIHFPRYYYENRQAIEETELVLERIPRDRSVTAETFFVPHLYRVKTLYMYPSENITSYMVMDKRHIDEGDRRSILAERNYRLADRGGFVLVYEREEN